MHFTYVLKNSDNNPLVYLEYFMLSECGVPLANLLRVLHVLNQAGGRDGETRAPGTSSVLPPNDPETGRRYSPAGIELGFRDAP